MAKKNFTRRSFLETTGASAIGVGATSALLACGDDTMTMTSGALRILQRNHFVPQYDTWLDDFAETWGMANNIRVEITRVPDSDLLSTADAAFAASDGFDLIEFISPPSAREPDVVILDDLNAQARSRFGDPIALARSSSFNPKSGSYYGYCVGWTPLPNLYRKSLWTAAGFPNGPTTWEELRDGGEMIKAATGEVVAIGMSGELDSSQSARALLWSFGGRIQDETNAIALDSDETRAALAFMADLFARTGDVAMEDVFNWTASNNNLALRSGNASLVNNPISAYRAPLLAGEAIADDIFLTPALPSAMGAARTPPCCLSVYVVPQFATNQNAAQDFLLDLTESYSDAVQNAALYNLPAYLSTVPTIDALLAADSASTPPDKLSILAQAPDWTVSLGWPGSAHPGVGQVWDQHILPTMFAAVAQGGNADTAIADALALIEPIFETWRDFI